MLCKNSLVQELYLREFNATLLTLVPKCQQPMKITEYKPIACCKPLVDKITSKITSWTSRFLSIVGRLKLINSMLCKMYNFWCNILLPKRVIKEVDGMFDWTESTI